MLSPTLIHIPLISIIINMSAVIVTPESFEHAKELLAEGKRDLLVHAIPDAVSNCSKACEIMAKHKGEKAAEALEENFEKHDIVAKAHTGDNTEEETEEEDEVMEGEKVGDEMETDAEKAEAGNLEQAWQMFDLAKVIYGKAGDVAKECESLTFLGEVSLENSNFK